VLVASDRCSAGKREDESGPAACRALACFTEVVEKVVVPDDYARIRAQLLDWCGRGLDVIVTVGGTGLSPRDVTPEATRSVIDKEVPAITQALLVQGLQQTPKAMLSRAAAGTRATSLIVNLPGSPRAVESGIEYLRESLPHAVEVLRGEANE
jgi:molybdenum cofactor synthesis domain-containing protein